MKQMRSRFRLIALLLICAFLLTLLLCSVTVLKTAGITLPSVSSLSLSGVSASPEPSVSGDTPSVRVTLPSNSETLPAATDLPGTDNSPDPEYNVFGL